MYHVISNDASKIEEPNDSDSERDDDASVTGFVSIFSSFAPHWIIFCPPPLPPDALRSTGSDWDDDDGATVSDELASAIDVLREAFLSDGVAKE